MAPRRSKFRTGLKTDKECIVTGHPHLVAEIDFAVDSEFACTSADVLTRRLRLGFLDNRAAQRALPKVNKHLGDKLGWNEARREQDRKTSLAFLQTLFTEVAT